MSAPSSTDTHDRRALVLKAVLLSVMFLASFGVCFFARELSFVVNGWPVHFWMAAQGAVLVFIGVVVVYAVAMRRLEKNEEEGARSTDV
ncbi:DUF4212 domain-containing protein [Hydrogenophaga sp. BPS33]|uniref:DUF4212 domain-containing protein n=1 Tax=Hydrogenophaga sp. BPS33 TaxID=2651974 RepID=UPI00131FE3AA|nr:sodium/substrate symporter small subunit [Hydrogenophaga sp. BPS33]QHE86686.1 DUF4212 domain-containing protein [Hydrogenophaga sp. BPS33]